MFLLSEQKKKSRASEIIVTESSQNGQVERADPSIFAAPDRRRPLAHLYAVLIDLKKNARELSGGLGICDLSENRRDGRRKGGIRKKSDNQKDRKNEDRATAPGRGRRAGRTGWRCCDYSGKVKCSCQRRGPLRHSGGPLKRRHGR